MSSTRETDDFDRLKLDYEQTVQLIRMLTDVRFKLLALVPTVSALGVVIAKDRTLGDALGIAIVGTVATVGLLVYELRNSQLYDAAMHRAKALERRMAFKRSNLDPSIPRPYEDPFGKALWRGGVFHERPSTLRLAGLLVKHDRALALVYAAAVTGWTYVFGSAFLPLLQEESIATPRQDATPDLPGLPIAIAAALGLVTWFLVKVFDRRGDDKRSARGQHAPRDHKAPLAVRVLVWRTKKDRDKGITKAEALCDANRPARATLPRS
jgi:hypothetical protein